MKPITVNVPEPLYRELQEYARANDRTTSELIREALVAFRDRLLNDRDTLRGRRPADLGKLSRPLGPNDDLLDEMIHARRR